jgi:tetratricopeptide (TPR) repeat protein
MFAQSRAYLLFAFSFLLCGGGAFAQITAIEGIVKGADGQPVVKAEILIVRKDMKGTYKGAKTDKKGHYIYNGLPIGTYKVSVLVDGQEKDFTDEVHTKLGDPTDISFDLKKNADEQAKVAKAAETGSLTKDQERGLTKEQKDSYEKKAKENAATIQKNKALNDAFNAGKDAMAAKNYDAATQSFAKATEIDPAQNVIWASLAESYAQLASTKTGAEQEDALTKSGAAWQKAIELKGDDAGYHNNYALSLAKAKKFPEAGAELEKAAQLDPSAAGKYYYNEGALLINSGQTDPACEAFKKSISADGNYADAQYQYGVCLVAKATVAPDGKIIPPDGTIQAFQKYLELKPDGQFAEAAKGMLATIQGGVDTKYTNPNAPKTPPKKKTGSQ